MGRLGAVATLLLMTIAAIVGVLLLAPGRNPSNDLVTLLSAPTCVTACWQGIQPLVTHRRMVRDYLDQQGIEFDVAMSAADRDSFIWAMEDDFPLAGMQEEMLVSVEFLLGDGTVWRIALHNVNLCASSVIAAYGVPPLADKNSFSIRFGYPDLGLLFGIQEDSARVTRLFIGARGWILSPVEPTPVNWEAMLDASRTCRDRLW
jgi:hypothetical protein